MRFVDDEGLVWTVRDVALLPERTLAEPGDEAAVERYFIKERGEKLLYMFAEGETRQPHPEHLERQLRGEAVRPATPE
ncbi:MAG TPA: hypothetical protein VKA54_15645 [Gemmatimonadaceae bacterium]|nr:hypothetical protein [Gemmatimonadaceae bacterium]